MSGDGRGALRRLWFNVHLWLGIGLVVLLAPLGLTGGVLVWREALATPAGAHGRAGLPASAYADAAARAFGPGLAVAVVRMPARPGLPVVVMGRSPSHASGGGPGAFGGHGRGHHTGRPHGERGSAGEGSGLEAGGHGPDRAPAAAQGGGGRGVTAWLDPSTGRVLASGRQGEGWLGWAHRFHETFLIPGWGRAAVGWCGWAMLASSLTGLWLWWPRRGSPLAGLRWRRTPETDLNLHHAVGFWIALPLALVSLTGAALAFPQTARAVIGVFAPFPPQAPGEGGRRGGRFAPPLARPSLGPDAAVARAEGEHADATLATLAYPTARDPAWTVELRTGARTAAFKVDDETGVVSSSPAPVLSPGEGVQRWVHHLHGGEETWLVWRWVLTLAGLAPTLLGVTGAVVWVRHTLRRRRMRSA